MGLAKDLRNIVLGISVIAGASVLADLYNTTPEQRIKRGEPSWYVPREGDMVSYCAMRQGVAEKNRKTYLKVIKEMPENMRLFHGQPRIREDGWLYAGVPVRLIKLRRGEFNCQPEASAGLYGTQ